MSRATSNRLRLAAWILLILVLLPGQIFWIFSLRGGRILCSEPTLIWGQFVLGLATIGVMALLKTTPADALRLSARASMCIVIGGTILLQLVAIVLLAPALSDDLFRYRLDGRMWLAGESPYATTPERFLEDHPPDPLDRLVPYRDYRTIYPPMSEAVFTVLRAVDDAVKLPGAEPAKGFWRDAVVRPRTRWHTIPFRAGFALFAIAPVGVLIRILRDSGQSVWWAAVLGFSPLLTLEIGMGHQDAIGIFFLVMAISATRVHRFGPGALALAMACGVKPMAGLLLPFLWRACHEEQSYRAGRRILLIFCAVLVVVFAPLLYQHGWSGWRQTLGQFGRTWEANGVVYESMKAVFGAGDAGRQMERAKDAARLLALLAVLGTGLLLWQARASLAEAAYWLFLVLLLCAPVAYPWYLLWVVAMTPLLRGGQGWTGLVWAATAGMSYTVWRAAPGDWRAPPAWMVGQYVPVLAALVIEIVGIARNAGARRAEAPLDAARERAG
jgi:alpha-1,6-mannosyltransferase